MIIKGNSRAGASNLAKHLLRTDTNEEVLVLETHSVRPDQAQGLHDCLREMEALSTMTKGKKGLYHANIDPATDYTMTEDQWLRSVEVLEIELNLTDQPRAIVMHKKDGREHLHVVWQRTDTDLWKLKSDSLNYPAHERASRALEREFGHDNVRGAFTGRKQDQPRPISELSHEDWQKMERTGLHPKDRRELVRELFEDSKSGAEFKAALNEYGFILAKGDRSPFVLVDPAGEIHALRSDFKGIYKAKEIYSHIEDVKNHLPTSDQAIALQLTRSERHVESEIPLETTTEKSIEQYIEDTVESHPSLEIPQIEEKKKEDTSGYSVEFTITPPPLQKQEPSEAPSKPIDQELLTIQARHNRELRVLNLTHDDQIADCRNQQSIDEIKLRQKLENKIAKEDKQIYQHIMKRKSAKPNKLTDEQKQHWERLEIEMNPRRVFTRKTTKIEFWEKVQPILEEYHDQQRESFEDRLHAKSEYEITALKNAQNKEQSRMLEEHSLQIESHQEKKIRLEIEEKRWEEIDRQEQERARERERNKDKDRGRDDR